MLMNKNVVAFLFALNALLAASAYGGALDPVVPRWTPKCVFGQMQPEFFVFTK